MRLSSYFCVALLAGSMPLATQAQDAALIEGTWRTAEQSELTIAPCDVGYCGYITKIVVPDHIAAAYGEDLLALEGSFTDLNNKDPALRDRPIQGLQILTLRPGPDASRFEGDIYNPQDGNVYSGTLDVLGPDNLRLQGCVLYVLCQEQEWQRVHVPEEAESGS
ncbi:MAG TPA: DUF2147 domain-containing protein [Devosiaceae bacterium]|jgi:uncharacterized protein (DUF2147 family)|nr:DUF2147 domain-containing protein [Devosiaceae bacterium]